jgi:hypothetical protein
VLKQALARLNRQIEARRASRRRLLQLIGTAGDLLTTS